MVRFAPRRVLQLPTHHADGNFYKHLVATGLAVVDTGRVAVDDSSSAADASLQAAVQAMDVDELRALVMTLVQRDGDAVGGQYQNGTVERFGVEDQGGLGPMRGRRQVEIAGVDVSTSGSSAG